MSQKATRKSQNATIVTEEKEKRDSPVKEMKKKIAANAEKEKQAADKNEKPAEKNDKPEPSDKNKSADKAEKNVEKSDKHDKSEKNEKSKEDTKKDKAVEKKSEKPENKTEEKKTDKPVEKKPEPAEKRDESKADKSKDKPVKAVNGTHNGGTAANGDDTNATVSDSSDAELVIEEDELFPELTYDDSDDTFEADATSRSLTRRSQVKATKTPETPRPASEKESEESKESKLLKLKDDANAVTSDRKLRSADSPKPETRKVDKKQQDSPKKQEQTTQEEEKKATKKDLEETEKEEPKDGKKENVDKLNLDVVIELENLEEPMPARTRARVSPYTRVRHDVTYTSVTADYTGNNSTMEMDITESSSAAEGEDTSMNDSGYLRAVRTMRGRASYRLLPELRLTNPNANRPRPPPQPLLPTAVGRPTGAVVGRKRKPSDDEEGIEESAPEIAVEAAEEEETRRHVKRMKAFDRLSLPFRRSGLTADIKGISTDLPLSAPVSPAFDPETIKSTSTPLAAAPSSRAHPAQRDANRCHIM